MKNIINLKEIWLFLLILICLLTITGGSVYFLYSLNNTGIIISIALTILLFIILILFRKKYNLITDSEFVKKEKISLFDSVNLFFIIYLILIFFSFYILFNNQTAESIVSPWEILPKYFFLVYTLATAILFVNIFLKQKLTILSISIFYLLSFTVAVFVFKIGFGYDPFIHQASADLISKTGSIEPKTYYYLGYYSLVIILHKITTISVIWLDKLLVPLLASIFLPLALCNSLKKWFSTKLKINLTITILLILPFSFFIITTPQSLAYLFLILTIAFGLNCQNHYDLMLIYLLAFSSLSQILFPLESKQHSPFLNSI